jgi:hypothetical protein
LQCWEAGLLFEENGGAPLRGEPFAHLGDGPAPICTNIIGPAGAPEDTPKTTSLTSSASAVIDNLSNRKPKTLARMHGSWSIRNEERQHVGLAEY